MSRDILDDFESIGNNEEANFHIVNGFYENFSTSKEIFKKLIQETDLIPNKNEQIANADAKLNQSVTDGKNFLKFLQGLNRPFSMENVTSKADNILKDTTLGMLEKINLISAINQKLGTKTQNYEFIIFRDFNPSFSASIEGMKYLALSLNRTKLMNENKILEDLTLENNMSMAYKNVYLREKFRNSLIDKFTQKQNRLTAYDNFNFFECKLLQTQYNFDSTWVFKEKI